MLKLTHIQCKPVCPIHFVPVTCRWPIFVPFIITTQQSVRAQWFLSRSCNCLGGFNIREVMNLCNCLGGVPFYGVNSHGEFIIVLIPPQVMMHLLYILAFYSCHMQPQLVDLYATHLAIPVCV